MIKTLIFSLLLALASYAVFQPPANAQSIELVPSSRHILEISEGMTLDELVRRSYPDDRDIWPLIKQKLIETNPYSFVQYSDQLIAGSRLKLVDVKRIYPAEKLLSKTKIGYVRDMSGQVSAHDINGHELVLQTNAVVFRGDRLETRQGAELHVIMDDGAEVFLKSDSVLKLSEYVITEGYGEDSSSVFDLLRGGLRTITGAIGASNSANYQVQTGLATIGIRGTEYVIKLCKQDDCNTTVSRNDSNAKLHAVVLDGSITLTSDDDVQILMALGEYGTATGDSLQIEENKTVPVGFLNEDEAYKFDVTVPQELELEKEQQVEEEESSSTWIWVVGILLLAVGL